MQQERGLARTDTKLAPVDQQVFLNELNFTDLYISATDIGQVFLRGVLDDPSSPLTRIDPNVVADIDELRRSLLDRSARPGADSFFFEHKGVRYRVTEINEISGKWFTLRRFLDEIPRMGSLNLPKMVYQALGGIARAGHGAIVFAGRTGEGKTTTAYSCLQEFLMQLGGPAMTIENPPEMKLSGQVGDYGHCFQVAVENGDFAGALKKALRSTPRYILLGEILSGEEARELLRASINGHVVLTTIHAGSIEEALQSIMKLSVDSTTNVEFARETLSQGIAAVIYQRLKTVIGPKGEAVRTIEADYLFLGGDSSPVRARIRDGKMAQLKSDIESQAARVRQNMSPIGKGN